MPEIHTFACKVCAAQKREVNRWWIVVGIVADEREKGGVLVTEFSHASWQAAQQDKRPGDIIEATCGEDHALQLASRWMVAGSFEPPSARKICTAESAEKPTPDSAVAAPSAVNSSSSTGKEGTNG